MKNKYPFYYYLLLLIGLIVAIVFWWLLLRSSNLTIFNSISNGNNGGDGSVSAGQYIIGQPIESEQIIIDNESKREIVSNLINVAVQDTMPKLDEFIEAFVATYDTSLYRIRFSDTTINYVQIEVPDKNRDQFKRDIKGKISNLSLLVWDEFLFRTAHVNTGNNVNWQFSAVDLSNQARQSYGEGIVIAVIDNGFDLNHINFKNKIVKPYNSVDFSSNVNYSNINHGTHVASLALGESNNTTSVEGMCPSCQLMPIKAEDANGYIASSYIIRGILYAIKQQADVINISLGLAIANNVQVPENFQNQYIENGGKDEENFWAEVFSYADKNNTICVLAAGNSNILTGFDPFQRSKETIKVGAVDENNHKTSFSNYGKYTTLYAPGVRLLGAKPNNQEEVLEGTSMAAPLVAGYIGLLKSKFPDSNNKEIIRMLLQNTKQVNQINVLKNQII